MRSGTGPHGGDDCATAEDDLDRITGLYNELVTVIARTGAEGATPMEQVRTLARAHDGQGEFYRRKAEEMAVELTFYRRKAEAAALYSAPEPRVGGTS